jgi:hypothetical protein
MASRDRALHEYEIWTPRVPLEVTLSIDPDQLEMAMATNGSSLRETLMRAIIFALVVHGEAELH